MAQFRGRKDKFGNDTALVGCKPNKNGYPVGWLDLGGGRLLKLEPSEAKKDGVLFWIKVTKKKSQQRNNSGSW